MGPGGCYHPHPHLHPGCPNPQHRLGSVQLGAPAARSGSGSRSRAKGLRAGTRSPRSAAGALRWAGGRGALGGAELAGRARACGPGPRARVGAPHAPRGPARPVVPRPRPRPPRPNPRARCRCAALPRLAAARTHRALGRQVADVLDGADVDDVDAAVLGRERRVFLVDPHRGRLCAGTAGRRALPIHGPGGLCKGYTAAFARARSLARSQGAGPPAPPAAPPAPAGRTLRSCKTARRALPARGTGGGHAAQIFRRNLNTGRKYSIPAGPLQVLFLSGQSGPLHFFFFFSFFEGGRGFRPGRKRPTAPTFRERLQRSHFCGRAPCRAETLLLRWKSGMVSPPLPPPPAGGLPLSLRPHLLQVASPAFCRPAPSGSPWLLVRPPPPPGWAP